MKSIMLLFVIGLALAGGPGSILAETSPMPICGTNPPASNSMPTCEWVSTITLEQHGNYTYTYDEKAGLWSPARDPQCLAKMEAAMRAMEPLAFGKPPTPQQFMDALQLFQDTKRDCWKEAQP